MTFVHSGLGAHEKREWRVRASMSADSGSNEIAYRRAEHFSCFGSWKPIRVAIRVAQINCVVAIGSLCFPEWIYVPVFHMTLSAAMAARAGDRPDPGLASRWADGLAGSAQLESVASSANGTFGNKYCGIRIVSIQEF